MNKTQKKETWRTKKTAAENRVHNHLLDIEKEQGWQLLFDGKTLNGWHLYNNPESASRWEVRDGALYCNASDESKPHGDLVTDHEFENYELVLEWRITGRGNSGVFINVQETPEIANTYQSGPEYQLLGANHMDYNVPDKRPGCLYGFAPQTNTVEIKPNGEWNRSRILQNQGKVQFYLNGVLTAEEDFTNREWKAKVAASGFANQAEFGAHTKGKIGLQNWYFEVWFRNIKVREL